MSAHFADGETADKVACLNWNSDAHLQLLDLCSPPEPSCLWALSGRNYSLVLSFFGKDIAALAVDLKALLCSAFWLRSLEHSGPLSETRGSEGWAWGRRGSQTCRTETGTALLRPASLAHGRSREKRSDVGSESKKLVSWVPALGARLAEFILGRNVKGTERRTKADLVSLQHLPSKRQ